MNCCPATKDFLDWCKFIDENKSKPEEGQAIKIVPIARYFGVDLCCDCGILGKDDQVELQLCTRAKWPKLPKTIPDYENVTETHSRAEEMRRVWIEALKQADKDCDRSACISSTEIRCLDCSRRKGCKGCTKWECQSCKEDTEAPDILAKWYKAVSTTSKEKARRIQAIKWPFDALNISDCTECYDSFCQN